MSVERLRRLSGDFFAKFLQIYKCLKLDRKGWRAGKKSEGVKIRTSSVTGRKVKGSRVDVRDCWNRDWGLCTRKFMPDFAIVSKIQMMVYLFGFFPASATRHSQHQIRYEKN